MLFDLAFPDRSHPRARWRGLHGAALPLALAESCGQRRGAARRLYAGRAAARAARIRARVLRSAGPAGSRIPGLRDTALRSLLAAPRHHFAAAAHARAVAAARTRDRARRSADGACSGCRRAASSMRIRSRSRPARNSISRRFACGSRPPAMPACRRWERPESSRSAARCSICSRWAAMRRCASI